MLGGTGPTSEQLPWCGVVWPLKIYVLGLQRKNGSKYEKMKMRVY